MEKNSGQSSDRPDLTIVIVNYNTAHLFSRVFSALDAARGSLSLQIIVIDNASKDESVDILRTQYPAVELVANATNLGFGRANNQALLMIRGRYALLLNTDAFVSPGTLAKTLDFMDQHPQCGVLGVKLIGEDGSLQPSCRFFPTPWNAFLTWSGLAPLFPGTRLVDDMSWDHASVRECDWVPGCYYLIRNEVIKTVGLFDNRYFLYYEEVDHCRAVKNAGWRVYYYPFTPVVHIGGESAKMEGQLTNAARQLQMLQMESELLYFRKHFGIRGIVTAIFLELIRFAIVVLKLLVGGASTNQATAAFRHARTTFKLLVATRFASYATR